MCSSALLPFGLPPSKAPSTIGRSWVQFLLMTEWKNPIFSEDFNFFDIRPRAKCVLLLFYILDFPRRKHPWRLGGHEFNSYSWQNENSEDFNFFDIWPRAKCVLLLFYILDFPLRKHPCRLGGHEFNSYSWQNEKIKFSQKISTFPTSDREQNVFYLLFYILDFPSKAPLKIGRSWDQFLLMSVKFSQSIFLRRFHLFPHLTERKNSGASPPRLSPSKRSLP